MLSVASTGNSVNSASGTQVLLSDNPFTKLDVTNIVSFQTISLLFNSEPAQPPSSAPYYSNTQIYQFAHGYNYIPSIWMMWQNLSPKTANPPMSGTDTTFYPTGDDTAGLIALDALNGTIDESGGAFLAQTYYNNGSIVLVTSAILYATVDQTNVYLSIMKLTDATVGGSVKPLYLAGTTLNLRIYCFTEPANNSNY